MFRILDLVLKCSEDKEYSLTTATRKKYGSPFGEGAESARFGSEFSLQFEFHSLFRILFVGLASYDDLSDVQ